MAALGGISLARVINMPPQLYPDELLYKLLIFGSDASGLPNAFYSLIYQPIRVCGADFYTCSKVLNVVLFMAFLLVAYLLARAFTTQFNSLLFMIFLGLGPLSGYTTLLSPEILFYLLSLLILYSFTRINEMNQKQFWLLQGLLHALLLLTKPHGVFMTVAVAALMLYLSIGRESFRTILNRFMTFLLSTYLFAIIIRLLITQDFSLNPIQGRYSSTITQVRENLGNTPQRELAGDRSLPGLLQAFLEQSGLHLATAIVCASAGILVLAVNVLKKRAATSQEITETAYIITLGAFLLGISLFSTLSVFWGEALQVRLMPRYYEHFLYIAPIFLLRNDVWRQKFVWIFGSVFALGIMLIQSPSMIIFIFDSYLLGIWRGLGLHLALVAVGTLVIALVVAVRSSYAKRFYGAFLAVVVFYFNFHYVIYAPQLLQSNTPALEAQATEAYLSQHTNDLVVVIALNRTDYNKFLFWQNRSTLQFEQNETLNQRALDNLTSQYDKVIVLPSVNLQEVTSQAIQFGAVKIFD